MPRYRVNTLLKPADLRYCFTLLSEDDDPRTAELAKELGRAVDRLNTDEETLAREERVK